jgi:hypothetical protein
MALEILIVPHAAGPSSFVLVDALRYPDWLESKAPTGYDRRSPQKVFNYLRRDMNDATRGTAFATGFYAELTKSVAAFVKDYFHTKVGYQITDTQVGTVIAGVPLTLAGVESLRNQTAKQVKELKDLKKTLINGQLGVWAEQVRVAAIRWWVTGIRLPTYTAPADKVTDAAVRDSAGVSCAVHTYDGSKWTEQGSRKEAVPRATGPNHAEMKWKEAHGDTLAGELSSVTRVDFHISEQPCGQYCAERMILWWKELAPATAEGYIVTYKEQDSTGRVYRLLDDMILRLA